MMTVHTHKLDILVIGAGQAGLAMGFHLKKTPFPPRSVRSRRSSWRCSSG